MPLVYDGPGVQFVPIQRPISNSFSAPWLVFVKFFPIQQNDIRLRCQMLVYKNLSATALGDFFTLLEGRTAADRAGFIARFNATTSDLVSLVPYYDFPRIQIWTESDLGLID